MKTNYIIFLLLISFNSCKSQDFKTCNIKTEYEFGDKKISNNKRVILVLETGFSNDYLKIYLNNKIITEGSFSTNREYGTAGEIVDYKYNEPPFFKIEFENKCLTFRTFEEYSIVFLHKEDEKWIIEYRNEFKIIE